MKARHAPSDFLSNILALKRNEVALAKSRVPINELMSRIRELSPVRDFAAALRKDDHVAVIAEMKKASPSAGLLRPDLDPESLARSYALNGAAAVSILTDEEFFQGHLENLSQARHACTLPILRKDFIIDSYQIVETRANGADAVLLIVAALEQPQLKELLATAGEFELHALVEIHNESELEIALSHEAAIVGINNRNLKTFEVSLQTSTRLAHTIPSECIKVAESGILCRAEVEQLAEHGIDAVLVGSHLMMEPDPGIALQHLTGVPRS